MKSKLQEILKHGMYGTPETKPEERNMFLSTIIERIYLALTKKQVIHKTMYEQAVTIMQSKKDITLFLNGQLSYSLYADYIQKANQYNVPFTIVNTDFDTPIGLVLASDEAIEQEEIFMKDKLFDLE